MLPLWTVIDLTYIYTSGRGKSLTHCGFLQKGSEDSGLPNFLQLTGDNNCVIMVIAQV